MSGPWRASRPFSVRQVRWSDVQWHVLLVALALLGVGLLFLQAMDQAFASQAHDEYRFDGHLEKVVLTLPLVLLGMFLRPDWLRRHASWFYGATLVLLALVPIVGEERNNAKRWIQLPMFDLQPSELAKLGLIVMLAGILHRNRLQRFGDWWAPVLVTVLPIGMVALQPDLGTALTIVPIALGMFYLAGARGKQLVAIVGAGLVLAVAAVRSEAIQDYQLQRIETWIGSYDHEDLIAQRNRLGFHVYHARTAIGNGGWFGRGLGRGIANETGYLPERDSDSIFAVVAEEAGFVGCGALLFLYTLLVLLLMGSAAQLRDRFARLAVGGVALYFGAHMFVNVAVNLGLLPMTGLTLPLVSTGGSSLLATFLALGLALGLGAHREPNLDQDAFRRY